MIDDLDTQDMADDSWSKRMIVSGALDLFRQKDVREEYSPIIEDDNPMEGTALLEDDGEGVPFSWFEYSIFALLGMAMLWAW
ncbi:hypothetical protein HYQ46_001369 [Verticillium longisporum]|nr:hypothetical protein HYQ46_001369 [Verticillium longisporum]